jgi:diguanylate cyclase (GGDEF)-like protein
MAAVMLLALWSRTRFILAGCLVSTLLWWLVHPAPDGSERFPLVLAVAARFLTLLGPSLAVIRVRRAAWRNKQLADVDPLTGLLNRRAFLRAAETTLNVLATASRPVTIAFFDVDRFKTVNDTHGHDAGDRLLIAVAQALRNNTRRDDLSGRWGGDEFVVLLAGVPAKHAETVVGRLQTAIRAAIAAQPTRSTLSAGVYSAPGSTSRLDPLIAAADTAMYRAKQAGGDTAAFDA